jgi:predicted DNA-binding transcriptional regulator AlpA
MAGSLTAPPSAATSLLLTQKQSWEYLGVSRAAWYRLRALGLLPRPVQLPGVDLRFRRADLERFAGRLRSAG